MPSWTKCNLFYTAMKHAGAIFGPVKTKSTCNPMRLKASDSVVEVARGGGFFAYVRDNMLCSAYGETAEEALENLEGVVDDFVSDMYTLEEFV